MRAFSLQPSGSLVNFVSVPFFHTHPHTCTHTHTHRHSHALALSHTHAHINHTAIKYRPDSTADASWRGEREDGPSEARLHRTHAPLTEQKHHKLWDDGRNTTAETPQTLGRRQKHHKLWEDGRNTTNSGTTAETPQSLKSSLNYYSQQTLRLRVNYIPY